MTLSPVSTKPRGADVSQLRVDRLIEVVGLDQGDSCCAIVASDNRGVNTRIEGRDNRGLKVVRGREMRRGDRRFLSVFPIVVCNNGAVGFV